MQQIEETLNDNILNQLDYKMDSLMIPIDVSELSKFILMNIKFLTKFRRSLPPKKFNRSLSLNHDLTGILNDKLVGVHDLVLRTQCTMRVVNTLRFIEVDDAYMTDNVVINRLRRDGCNNIPKTILASHELFTEFMFCTIEGKSLHTRFDKVFGETIDKVFKGEILHLVINIPVGMGKTARAVIAVVARGFAMESKSKFLHVSYDKTLAQNNSSIIKDFLQSDDYQFLYPLPIKEDTTAKGLWKTEDGGQIRAISTGGGITGFRAGSIAIDGFSGMLIFDDPMKPDDANSPTKKALVNKRYDNTLRSRLAHPNIPTIVIMQRLDKNDFTNHLFKQYGKEWTHLCIPAMIETDNMITSDIRSKPIELNLSKGALWVEQKNITELEKDKKFNSQFYYAQLQQNPIVVGGSNMLKGSWLQYVKEPLGIRKVMIFGDVANKTGTYNDHTVFIAVGYSDSHIYILDMFRDKVEMPMLIVRMQEFYDRWNKYPKWKCPKCYQICIEDKANGTGLIQMLRSKGLNVRAIQRNKDKVYRLSNVSHYIHQGVIRVIKSNKFNPDIAREFDEFTHNDTHESDDIIDCVIDAIDEEYRDSNSQYKDVVLESFLPI